MRRLPLSLLALVLVPGAASAAPRPLRLDDALALARKNNRDLQAAKARLDQSAVAIEQAWVPLLPQVSAQGKYTHNYKEVVVDFSATAKLSAAQGQLQGDTFNDLYSKLGQQPSQQVISDAQAVAAAEKALASGGGGSTNSGQAVIQKGEQLDGLLAATVPLVVPSAYPALDAAKKSYAAAQSGFSVTEAQVLYQTAQAFYVAAGNDELVVARQHAIDVAKQTVDQAQAKFELGTVNRVEVMRAQLALVQAQQRMAEAADGQAQAYRALGTILGTREELHVVPAEVAPPVPTSDADALAKDALSLRPEFSQLDRTLRASDATIASDWWKWAPTLSAFGNVRVFNYAGFNGDPYSWAVGLQLDWLLYDGGLRDVQRHLAVAQRRESEARLSLLRDTIADDIANSERALATRRKALDTAERSVALSRETLELVRVQHEAGTATQLDLLSAQDTLVAAEVSLAQARFDLAVADLTLRRNAGTFPTP